MSIPDIFEGYKTMYWSVYLVCITGAVFQTLLLACLFKDPLRCFRNSATYLVANLSVCDLAVVLQMLFGTFNSQVLHVRALSHIPFYASILSIWCIAVDRYLIVAHPFKHRVLMSGKKAGIWIVFIWILSAFDPVYRTLTGTIKGLSKFKYGIMSVVIFLTSTTYIITFVTLKRQAKWLHSCEDQRHACKTKMANEKRFLNTIIVVAVVALICLTPATVYGSVKQPGLDSDMEENILFCFLITILSFNFAINPVVYFIRLKNYRKTFFIVLCRKRVISRCVV